MRRKLSFPQPDINTEYTLIRRAVVKALLQPQFSEWQATTGDAVDIAQRIFNDIGRAGYGLAFLDKYTLAGSEGISPNTNSADSASDSLPVQ